MVEQMADGRRKHVIVAFVIVVVLLETAERLGDVAGDRRFLRNDKRLTHSLLRGKLAEKILFVKFNPLSPGADLNRKPRRVKAGMT